MDKRFWGVIVGIAVVFGIIFWISGNHNKAAAPSSSSQPTNHVEGEGKDGITLVEYGDYQCPFCGQFYPIVKQVQAEYSSQVVFQFRNLPLVQLHQNAFAGARAAEAGALQGKFWQMHDTLYDNQDPNGASGWVASTNPLNDYFVGFASKIGLNVTQFKADYASDKVNNSITADEAAFAKTHQQEATPSFFLDGTYVSPSESLSSFESLINAEIKKKGFTPPASSSSSTPSSSTGSTPQSKQ
jgi:protein-disulfide isomerase